MRFIDISVDRFGVLQESELKDLSSGTTVVFGGNGSGKTTMVNFLRGLLFGYTTEHQGFQQNDGRFGGSVSLESQGRSYRLTRERNGIISDLSQVDLVTGIATTNANAELPAWVNETVYREIFSVDEQEAVRFDLLTRLCLDGDDRANAENEIRKAEIAIEQSVREREGFGSDGGLRQAMNTLRQQRDELSRQLDEMRRIAPGNPVRIAEVDAEIHQLRNSLVGLERQIRDVTNEIHRLEQQLEILRRRNVVPLNRLAIADQISELTARMDRWASIRQSIQREISQINPSAMNGLQSRDSLKSIRALVTRLEERMDAVQRDEQGNMAIAGAANQDVGIEHLRSEVFSLCDYVTQHESAIESHEAALESLLGQRTLHDAEHIETVLSGQIQTLQAELQRSDDVIAASRNVALACHSQNHAEHDGTAVSGLTSSGSIAELETQLTMLRQRLAELKSDSTGVAQRIYNLEQELSALRTQMQSAARLEDIDRVKASIADIDARLQQHQERWDVLERTESHLRLVIQRLKDYRDPQVLELASRYITRLTDGDCHRLFSDRASGQILADTRQASHAMKLQQLSRGTRDQVALTLRLALLQSRAADTGRCPLILDDVFITSDDDRGAAVADLLMDVAADGQQIIFFTCQHDVMELFRRRQADIRYLSDAPTEVPAPTVAPVSVASIPITPPAPAPQPVANENTNWLYYLEVDNSVEDLSGLTVAEVEAFRASGIETIDQLLTVSVEDLEQRFKQGGYSISRDRIRAWHGQAELATQIPMLRRSDAELLYAAGIQSTVELSRMRPETVYDMVVAFQETKVGGRYQRSGRNIDRQQAINWSRWSQHARSLTDARRSRSRFFVGSDDTDAGPNFSSVRSSGSRSGNGPRHRRARISRTSGATTRRQRRPRLSTDDRRERDSRQTQRRQRLARHSSSYRTKSNAGTDESASTERELKFYLNRSDDVEAAPSIGPKTAQRLGVVGVFTVDDLIQADAFDIASRLDNKRITAETIQQWQAQSRLVCQVPYLRGHDSQLLVACGVTDPEQLSQKRPVDLFALIGPFADTSEGERIVRGGKKPDLEEVTDWVSWAQQSRSLKSAA